MTISLKDIVKNHVVVNSDKSDITVSLNKVKEGEWEIARKAEYKKDVYAIPENELFLEVCLHRAGEYHSDYVYGKPTYQLVKKIVKHVVLYPAISGFSKEKALELKNKYFNKDDETELVSVYDSGSWKRAHKIQYWETVYDIEGVLLKRTLLGNSDWTEFVEYEIVEKKEEDVVSFSS